ncbi:IS630 transposase-related protein, partial [Acidiphilium multivorum]
MVKVLSLDLRERVVAAIDGGMSRRQAAERFGVGIATAVRWAQLAREKGSPAPMKVGGDRRSERIESPVKMRTLLILPRCFSGGQYWDLQGLGDLRGKTLQNRWSVA